MSRTVCRRPSATWALVVLLVAAACGGPAPRNLDDLLVQDSTYLDPETRAAVSGPVFRTFGGDPDRVMLRGELLDGVWNGDLDVFHPNGRLRYQGRLVDGKPCGAWLENQDPEPPGDLFEELKQEIESMGLYPPCPDDR